MSDVWVTYRVSPSVSDSAVKAALLSLLRSQTDVQPPCTLNYQSVGQPTSQNTHRAPTDFSKTSSVVFTLFQLSSAFLKNTFNLSELRAKQSILGHSFQSVQSPNNPSTAQ